MPDHPLPLSLIRELDVPILGPSANFHGEKTPFRYEALDQRLMDLVDFVVPGDCTVRRASTVVDCSTHPATIVRQGAVQLSEDDMKI
jgi:L-threonylcarbamoyladenylate synthase